MRILFYGLNYAPEQVGIGKYSGEMATWLAAHGHEIRVMTAPPYFPRWQVGGDQHCGSKRYRNRYSREWIEGVKICRSPLWVPARPTGVTRLVHLASFAISSLPPLLAQARWRPELVITVAPAFFCAPGALLLGWRVGRRCRTWLHVQDFELDAAFELGMLKGGWIRRLAEAWERKTLRSFDRVSSISQAMVKLLLEKGVEPSRTRLLPNWVDLEAILPQGEEARVRNPYRLKLGIRPEQTVLMYSGSMSRKQGLGILAEVIRRLGERQDLVWLLAGEGPARAELAAACGDLPQVKLLTLQPLERLNDWLNAADIHLLPQRAAAADLVLPSKLLGILASGRPVVASSPEGSELAVLAQQAGLCVMPEDADAFTEAVRRLADDRHLRATTGLRARQLAELRFGREQVLSRLERDLTALLAE
jgi:colanic acid biosynthesis glycosyl transferase WcaI